MTKLWSPLIIAATLTACAGSNPQVRKDIIAQMQTIKAPLDACYEIALARNRRLPGGMITVEFIAEAGTGKFKDALIRRDEIQDPQVRMCVLTEVQKLKLPKPTSSNTQIPYAFRFTAVD